MKVSILIPTYKPNPGFLKEALESLLSQTEQDFEVIICDEPTEVDTRAIVENYLHDKRFTFFQNGKQLGIGGNWNQCLQKATAPFVQFLFQDDVWEPHYLESALRVMQEHPSVGMVALNHEYLCDEGIASESGYRELEEMKDERMKEGLYEGKEFLKEWLGTELHPNLIGEPPFVMMRRSVVKNVGGFHENMHQFLDVEYWVRMLLVSDLYYLNGNYGAFRVHEEGASHRNQESGRGVFDRFTCIDQLINTLRGDPLQNEAIAAQNRALDVMVWKFLNRLKNGKSIQTTGSGALRSFAFRHPIRVFRSVARVLSERKRRQSR